MSTDQALLEALEEHHKEAIEQGMRMTSTIGRPTKNCTLADFRADMRELVRAAFLAGAIEQAKNPLPPANK